MGRLNHSCMSGVHGEADFGNYEQIISDDAFGVSLPAPATQSSSFLDKLKSSKVLIALGLAAAFFLFTSRMPKVRKISSRKRLMTRAARFRRKLSSARRAKKLREAKILSRKLKKLEKILARRRAIREKGMNFSRYKSKRKAA